MSLFLKPSTPACQNAFIKEKHDLYKWVYEDWSNGDPIFGGPVQPGLFGGRFPNQYNDSCYTRDSFYKFDLSGKSLRPRRYGIPNGSNWYQYLSPYLSCFNCFNSTACSVNPGSLSEEQLNNLKNIGAWNCGAWPAVLISPRHLISTKHWVTYGPDVSDFSFLLKNNVTINKLATRVKINGADIFSSDAVLWRLNDPLGLSNEINQNLISIYNEYFDINENSTRNYLDNLCNNPNISLRPILYGIDGGDRVFRGHATFSGMNFGCSSETLFNTINDPNQIQLFRIATGDSGSPIFGYDITSRKTIYLGGLYGAEYTHVSGTTTTGNLGKLLQELSNYGYTLNKININNVKLFDLNDLLTISKSADLNNDGKVDAQDLVILTSNWESPAYDLDGDNIVSSSDVAKLLSSWTQESNFRISQSSNEAINGDSFSFTASKEQELKGANISFHSKKKINSNVRKVVEVGKKGLLSGSKENQDLTFSLDVNEELNVLFSDFRSDCSDSPFIFEGYVPVFLEKSNNRNNDIVSNSDLLINGLPYVSMTFVYGNNYRIIVPNTFGNMYISSNNSKDHIQVVSFNEKYREYEIVKSKDGGGYFSIKFDRLPLVEIKCNLLFDKSASIKNSMIRHPLSFYSYDLVGERWLLSSPEYMMVEKVRKSNYNYYSNGGDEYSYYINSFENPILIFDYDIVYKIENKNKINNPFYFDFKSEGMLKTPYNDFENDINTDRSYLNILFPSDEKRNSLEIDPFIMTRGNVGELGVLDYWEDPYQELPPFKERYPTYDPDNMFYCSSKNQYFGNRVLVGKRFIHEVIGKYGVSAPNVKKVSFTKNGSYFLYDVFNHVSGKFIFINCLNFNDVIFDKDSPISQKLIDKQTRDHISSNNSFTNFYFVPDVFGSYENIVHDMVGKVSNNFFYDQGPISILIPADIIDFESQGSINMYKFYLATSKQNDSESVRAKFQFDFLRLIKKIVDGVKGKSIFEVTVEYI